MLGALTTMLAFLKTLALLAPLAISQEFFTAIVAAGILGSMLVAVIIIGYTVYEFRRHEIW